ncbi:S8 family serine peptidase [Actinomadura violacea]|uniref:S8 family serine peptidase n=1 Tax=Actinomadura violacea TaxID=2819934 RepID=A0ABS3RIN2_9ACTN|nr:S8 family serine peptidase [Actinomadura violacea]MBO2456599.1 S8 family serine peptidase [Actinomadura violacea]
MGPQVTACYRAVAALAAAALVLVTAPPASAELRPRNDEWWFSAWNVQKAVWPLSRGAGTTVALLDTGVDARIPELSGAVLKGADTAGGKTDGRKDLDAYEDGHGTSMAVMIAGQGGGNSGYVGIAPEAKILPVNVMTKNVVGSDIDPTDAVANGIRFAVDRGAKVINLSFGGGSAEIPHQCPKKLLDTTAYAIDHDVVLVSSSGNDGKTINSPEAPGSCPGVVAVGGIDSNLRTWERTQRQPYVAVAAPATGSVVVGRDDKVYADAEGTSGAAALVSGAVALIRAHNPNMSARTVVQRLLATALPVNKPIPDQATGYGAIRIAHAMDTAKYPVPANAPNPVYNRFDQLRGAAHKVNAAPATEARKSTSGPSPVIYAAVAGLAVLLAGGLVFLWLRARRPRRPSPL